MIPVGTERKVLLSFPLRRNFEALNFIISRWFHRFCYLNDLKRQIESDKIVGKIIISTTDIISTWFIINQVKSEPKFMIIIFATS